MRVEAMNSGVQMEFSASLSPRVFHNPIKKGLTIAFRPLAARRYKLLNAYNLSPCQALPDGETGDRFYFRALGKKGELVTVD